MPSLLLLLCLLAIEVDDSQLYMVELPPPTAELTVELQDELNNLLHDDHEWPDEATVDVQMEKMGFRPRAGALSVNLPYGMSASLAPDLTLGLNSQVVNIRANPKVGEVSVSKGWFTVQACTDKVGASASVPLGKFSLGARAYRNAQGEDTYEGNLRYSW